LALLDGKPSALTEKISLVIPVYNEFENLERAVAVSRDFLASMDSNFEIIIAEDGSTDGTKDVALSLSNADPRVWCIFNEDRLGRGKALKEAFKCSSGEILVYIDVDLSTEVGFLEPLIGAIAEGNDFATGSRMMPESRATRSTKRRVASGVYNGLVRFFLGSPFRDHQCGFKAFRRESLFDILDQVQADHWFWDTEVLVLANKNGFSVKEVPVVWDEGDGTKVNLLKDFIKMGSQILKLWWRLQSP
jgi:hypothetical protein